MASQNTTTMPNEVQSNQNLEISKANKIEDESTINKSQKSDEKEANSQDVPSEPPSERPVDTGVPYSAFTPAQKKGIVFIGAFGAVFSPMSTTIYLPALNTLAAELHVSNAKINLTVTTFLVRHLNPFSLLGIQYLRATDPSRYCSNTGSWIFGYFRSPPSVHCLLRHLFVRQYWPCFADIICGAHGIALLAECWEQWNRRFGLWHYC